MDVLCVTLAVVIQINYRRARVELRDQENREIREVCKKREWKGGRYKTKFGGLGRLMFSHLGKAGLIPNEEGVMGGKEGNVAKGKGYEGMMGSKEGFVGMKRGKRGNEGKRGKKMGGESDWLLKRGIWEKQVAPKIA